MARDRRSPHPVNDRPAQPFVSAEAAWFWFVQAHLAQQAGARTVGGAGEVPRPCEPLDIFRVVDRLYRQRLLVRDHLAVLAHYGRRLMAPDPQRWREQRACGLWREALARIEEPLRGKGIVAG